MAAATRLEGARSRGRAWLAKASREQVPDESAVNSGHEWVGGDEARAASTPDETIVGESECGPGNDEGNDSKHVRPPWFLRFSVAPRPCRAHAPSSAARRARMPGACPAERRARSHRGRS